ncbi:hypothetical protein APTSU1_000947900 [Apodemus speciosus]|uniref:Uncharacterized protein n=1 Tax=Apodemus speciosus TaxID=105296 RepID=A0ABQ0F4P4_APOSI
MGSCCSRRDFSINCWNKTNCENLAVKNFQYGKLLFLRDFSINCWNKTNCENLAVKNFQYGKLLFPSSLLFPFEDNIRVVVPKEETTPRPELTPPVRKRYRKTKRMPRDVKPSQGVRRSAVGPYGDIGSSSSTSEGPPLVRTADYTNISLQRPRTISHLEIVRTVEKACGPADDIDMFEENTDDLGRENSLQSDDPGGGIDDNTEDDSDISRSRKVIKETGSSSRSSLESNYVGSSDTDTSSSIVKASVSLESEKYVSGMSDKRQMKTPHGKESKQSPIKVQSKKSRCFNAVLKRLGLKPTESASVTSETTTVEMAEKACGIKEDLYEEEQHLEALGKEVTLPFTEITAMMKKLGIRYSISLVHVRRTVPLPETTVEKAHGTRADIGGGDDNYDSSSQNLPRSRDRNSELHRERMNVLRREVTPPLAEAQPRNRSCVSAILRRLGCEKIDSEKEPDIIVLYTAEKACTTNDIEGVEDSTEDESANEKVICEQNQMTASEEEGGQSLLIKIQSRRRKCGNVSALLRRLGLRWIQAREHSDGMPQTKPVLTADKACGTRDDSDMFEEDSEDDFGRENSLQSDDPGSDIEYANKDKNEDNLDDDLDGDDVGNELEIHNIYERNIINNLSSDDSLHSYELVTDFIMDSSEELSDTEDDIMVNKHTDSTNDSAESKANPVGPPRYAWEDNNHIKK